MTQLDVAAVGAAALAAGIALGFLIGDAVLWQVRRMQQRRIRREWEESHPGMDWDEWMAR